jgi:hypothetical protein
MSQEISIKLSVQDAEALQKLMNFVSQANSGLSQLGKAQPLNELANATNGWTTALTKNRMALMELGHTARATTDLLIVGGSPRMLLAQIPQVIQGITMMGVSLMTIAEILAVVGVAAGAGYLVWRQYTQGEREAAEAAKLLKEQMEGTAKILQQMRDLQKADLMSPASFKRNVDILTGKTQLYKSAIDGSITTSPTSQREETKTLYNFGTGLESTIKTGRTLQIQNDKASAKEVLEYVQKNIDLTGKLDDSQIKASDKIREMRAEVSAEAVSETEKEKQKIHEKYQKERDELDDLSVKMGSLNTPAQQRATDEARHSLDIQEMLDKQAVDMREQDKERQAAGEAFNRGQELYQREWQNMKYLSERQITQDTINQSMSRADAIAYEFKKRIDNADSAIYQGIIDEKAYTKEVEDATAKRLEAQKELNKAKEVALDLVTKEQRSERERTIRESPFLTDKQKFDMLSAGGFHDKKTLVDPQSLSQNMAAAMVRLKNQWGTMAQQMATTFSSLMNTAIDSISNGITGLIEGTKTWGQALMEIGNAIVTTIISAIVKMAVTWVANQVMMAIAGKSIQAAATAATAPIAAAASAIWAVPATLATIASYGAAAASAPGFIALAEGIVAAESIPAMRTGGDAYAGRPIIVGEDRPEVFVPSENGRIHPYVSSFGADGSERSARGEGSTFVVHNHHWTDSRQMMRFITSNPEFDHQVMDTVSRKSYTIRRRGDA